MASEKIPIELGVNSDGSGEIKKSSFRSSKCPMRGFLTGRFVALTWTMIPGDEDINPEKRTAGTPKNWWFCRCFSFSKGVFSGSMLVLEGIVTMDDYG